MKQIEIIVPRDFLPIVLKTLCGNYTAIEHAKRPLGIVTVSHLDCEWYRVTCDYAEKLVDVNRVKKIESWANQLISLYHSPINRYRHPFVKVLSRQTIH